MDEEFEIAGVAAKWVQFYYDLHFEKITIEIIERTMPNHKACSLFILQVGIGLKHVLLITASTSDSYHMFNAPAAPEPIAPANKDKLAVAKETSLGATSKPTIAVNKTRDITLGFISNKKDLI